MQIAYSSEGMLPGQAGVLQLLHQSSAYQQEPSLTKSPHDRLAQQQAIYEELLASQELTLERERPALKTRSRPLSAREMTRDLAGWTVPRTGAYG